MRRSIGIVLFVAAGLAILVLTQSTHGPFGPDQNIARERVLRADLQFLRLAIRDFHEERKRYPSSASELVEARYVRKIPPDPLTNSTETWIWEGCLGEAGICNVHSGDPRHGAW